MDNLNDESELDHDFDETQKKLDEFLKTSEKELMCAFTKSENSLLYFFEMNACLTSIIDRYQKFYHDELQEADKTREEIQARLQELIEEEKRKIEEEIKELEADHQNEKNQLAAEYDKQLNEWKKARKAAGLDPDDETSEDRPKRPEEPKKKIIDIYEPTEEDKFTPAFDIIQPLQVKTSVELLKESAEYTELIEQLEGIQDLKDQRETTLSRFYAAKNDILEKCKFFFEQDNNGLREMILKKPFNAIYIEQINSLEDRLKQAIDNLEKLQDIEKNKIIVDQQVSYLERDLDSIKNELQREKLEVQKVRDELKKKGDLESNAQEVADLQRQIKILQQEKKNYFDKLQKVEASLEEETSAQLMSLKEVREDLETRIRQHEAQTERFEIRVKNFEEEKSRQQNTIAERQRLLEDRDQQLKARAKDLEAQEKKLLRPEEERPRTSMILSGFDNTNQLSFRGLRDEDEKMDENPRSRSNLQMRDTTLRDRSGSRPRAGRSDADVTEDMRRQRNELTKLRKELDDRSDQVKREVEAFKRREEDQLNQRKRFEDEKRVFNDTFRRHNPDQRAVTTTNPFVLLAFAVLLLFGGFYLGHRLKTCSKEL